MTSRTSLSLPEGLTEADVRAAAHSSPRLNAERRAFRPYLLTNPSEYVEGHYFRGAMTDHLARGTSPTPDELRRVFARAWLVCRASDDEFRTLTQQGAER